MTSSMRLVVGGGQSLDMMLRKAVDEETRSDEVIAVSDHCRVQSYSKGECGEAGARCSDCYFVLGLVA
jgi:hypothetical protein